MKSLNQTQILPKWRIVIMRGLYLLTFVGLAFDSYSTLFNPGEMLDTITGVAFVFWASYATLMGFGVRYPVQMMPLLFLQLFYKALWIIGVYMPMYNAGVVTENAQSFFWICVTAVILDVIVIPWPYVLNNYVKVFFKFQSQPV
ncbi:MAG: hypothetical protein NXI20_00090 [bacterium]|nr:hypothetical protein [bacterium]